MPHQHRHDWHDKRALALETMGLLAEIKTMDPDWSEQDDQRLSAASEVWNEQQEPGDGQEGVTR